MCVLPSQLRIRMVLMVTGIPSLPEGECPGLALVHIAWMCLIILRQGVNVLHRGRPSQPLVHAIRVPARIKFKVTGTLRSGFCIIQRALTVFFLSVRTFFPFLNS
jgi:hypothetical protein